MVCELSSRIHHTRPPKRREEYLLCRNHSIINLGYYRPEFGNKFSNAVVRQSIWLISFIKQSLNQVFFLIAVVKSVQFRQSMILSLNNDIRDKTSVYIISKKRKKRKETPVLSLKIETMKGLKKKEKKKEREKKNKEISKCDYFRSQLLKHRIWNFMAT